MAAAEKTKPATFTLDELKARLEQRYGPFVVGLPDGDVKMLAAIRLPEDRRKQLLAGQEALSKAEGDQDLDRMTELMRETFRLICESDEQAQRLLSAFAGPDELALLSLLFEEWTERTQPGEASSSPS